MLVFKWKLHCIKFKTPIASSGNTSNYSFGWCVGAYLLQFCCCSDTIFFSTIQSQTTVTIFPKIILIITIIFSKTISKVLNSCIAMRERKRWKICASYKTRKIRKVHTPFLWSITLFTHESRTLTCPHDCFTIVVLLCFVLFISFIRSSITFK